MGKLTSILDAGQQQLTLDELLAEIEAENRDESPPEGVAVATVGADLDIEEGASRAKIGTEPHNGLCPYMAQCETRRRQLSHYRPGVACHWVTWRNWQNCPIYQQNGGNGNAKG